MAIAEFTIICPTCGEEFGVRRKCYNRKDADNYEAWVKSHPYNCPKCYKAAKIAETESKAAEFVARVGLPEIVGKSDKQIKFATDLRTKYLVGDHPIYACWDELIPTIRSGKFASIVEKNAQKMNIPIPESLYNTLHRMNLEVLVILRVTVDAHEIIELLYGEIWNENMWLKSEVEKKRMHIVSLTASAYYKLEESVSSTNQ